MDKLKKEDWKYIPEKAEEGFDPERNKRIIDSTIKKYEKIRAQKIKTWREGVAERSDALAQYFTSPKFSSTPFGKYFGKKWMAYLRGEIALDEIYARRLQTNTNQLYKSIYAQTKTKSKT